MSECDPNPIIFTSQRCPSSSSSYNTVSVTHSLPPWCVDNDSTRTGGGDSGVGSRAQPVATPRVSQTEKDPSLLVPALLLKLQQVFEMSAHSALVWDCEKGDQVLQPARLL
eukprot:4008676-Prymnesium_polylepis.1